MNAEMVERLKIVAESIRRPDKSHSRAGKELHKAADLIASLSADLAKVTGERDAARNALDRARAEHKLGAAEFHDELAKERWHRKRAEARALAAEAALAKAVEDEREFLEWASDTLTEINVSNYDHDDVCRLNAASVEVILGLAAVTEPRLCNDAALSTAPAPAGEEA